MNRLYKLYNTMDNLHEWGLTMNEDLERKANEIEEEIIKRGIIQ